MTSKKLVLQIRWSGNTIFRGNNFDIILLCLLQIIQGIFCPVLSCLFGSSAGLSSSILNKRFLQEAFISKSLHRETCVQAPDDLSTWSGAQTDRFIPVTVQNTIFNLHFTLLFLNQGLGVPSGHFSKRIKSVPLIPSSWGS